MRIDSLDLFDTTKSVIHEHHEVRKISNTVKTGIILLRGTPPGNTFPLSLFLIIPHPPDLSWFCLLPNLARCVLTVSEFFSVFIPLSPSGGRWFSLGRQQGWARLRASNEGLLRPRVARAMERPCCLPSLSSHRPFFFVPRHLPKHPLIPRADNERFFHPSLFFLACRLGPLVHFLAHPALHLGEFRRCVEHEPVSIRMILIRRAMLQEMLPDDDSRSRRRGGQRQ